jgi:photosystem II stability/assembly factor-like uncharacterized protein
MRRFALLALMIVASGMPAAAQHARRSSARDAGAGPAARYDDWRVIGPGGGGTMVGPTISPHDARLVVEHCDMTGAYITADGARSWRMFNLRTVVSTFAFDPGDPSVIYAGNAALWRSEDTGKTWRMVFPDPAKNTSEYTWGDHAEYVVTTDDEAYPASGDLINIQAVAVHPSDSNRLYVVFGSGFRSPQPSSLYASRDRGKTWARVTEFGQERVFAVHVRPGDSGDVVYVVSESGVHVGDGERWERRGAPEGRKIEQASAGNAGADLTVYATTESAWDGRALRGGVYASSDGGRTWRLASALAGLDRRPGEGEPPQFRAVACSERNASVAYVGFRGLRLGEGPANLFNGIAKTADGGKTWAIVHKESNRASPNLEGSWIEGRAPDSYPNIWFDAPYSLGVAPADPRVCYATDLFRTYRTVDGGRTWRQVNSVRVGPDRWTTRGLDVTTTYGVHFDPFDVRNVFITYTDIGLFRSADGGASWTGATVGVPNRWRNTTYWLAFDPKVRGLVWGAFSSAHDLPRPKMWRNRDPHTYQGGVAVSTDGGRRWEASSTGMPQAAVTHVLLDPESPVGNRTLYACAFGRGVYKSTDNGKTWSLKNRGLEGAQPFVWRLTRAGGGALYLVVARRSERGKIGDEEDGALYKSIDGGERWVKMKLPEGTNGPMGLTLDPRDERRMYLAAWGVARPDGDTGGGVFLSTDGGETWRNVFDRSQHVYDVTVDPGDPRVLYVGTFDSAVYRSADGGEAWSRVRGYNFKWGHRVVVDPVRPGKIFVTTFGGSVWHGPAAGDPDAPDDVVSPQGPPLARPPARAGGS